jgi:hypothetical protein
MPFTPSYYGPDDPEKPLAVIVFHNNSACSSGKGIALLDRLPSTGGHRICDECLQLNKSGR